MWAGELAVTSLCRRNSVHSSSRDAAFGAGRESILPLAVMDSGLARLARALSDKRYALARGMTNLVYRPHCRGDQLDGVVAVPLRRPGNGGDLAALGIDQHRGRHSQRSAYGFKILKNLGFLVAKIIEPGQIGLFQEILRLFRVAGVDIDGDHLDIGAAQLGLQALKRRHLLAARHTPSCPQIDQDRWPAPIGEPFGLAIRVLEAEVR